MGFGCITRFSKSITPLSQRPQPLGLEYLIERLVLSIDFKVKFISDSSKQITLVNFGLHLMLLKV